ncbi:hypothetical protein JVU11DRAFT_133 [Chiua virens]|nr:hypothetical protein JVU11DRAFT_133 [Chiua virens]
MTSPCQTVLHHSFVMTVPNDGQDTSPATDMADVLLAVQMEKLRVEEALAARDNVVAHLEDAYISRASTPATTSSSGFEVVVKPPGTPRCETFEDTQKDAAQGNPEKAVLSEPPCTPDRLSSDGLQSNSAYCRQVFINTSALVREPYTPTNSALADDEENQVSFVVPSGTPAKRTIAARQKMLASLPLPSGIPDDALQPIMIHPGHTLHEFLGNATGVFLSQPTTYWCPDREEHGYFLTPVFKCNTNLRVTTAHRWSAVDVIGQMSDHTECFYNRDGRWYYAGTYKAFQIDDLTVQEWETLSTEWLRRRPKQSSRKL